MLASLELHPSHITLPFPTSSYSHPFLFPRRLLSALIGRSVRIRQCLRSFYPLVPSSFAPVVVLVFFFFFKNRTLCIVVFGFLLTSSFFSSPSCLIGIIISRLRQSSTRGRHPPPPPPRSRLPSILSRGVAPRPAIDSDRAILLWANGRSHPKTKRSSRLLLGSAWVGRTRVEPPSGLRSSRRARDPIMCPCTSDVDFFFLSNK